MHQLDLWEKLLAPTFSMAGPAKGFFRARRREKDSMVLAKLTTICGSLTRAARTCLNIASSSSSIVATVPGSVAATMPGCLLPPGRWTMPTERTTWSTKKQSTSNLCCWLCKAYGFLFRHLLPGSEQCSVTDAHVSQESPLISWTLWLKQPATGHFDAGSKRYSTVFGLLSAHLVRRI